jgi:hypothetical protein
MSETADDLARLRELAERLRADTAFLRDRISATLRVIANDTDEASAAILSLLRDLEAAKVDRDELLDGTRAVIPQTREHAENLYTVAVACLKSYGVDPEAENVRLREALTPSGDTKAAYIGDFSFPITLRLGHEEETRRVDVPWTTIKEIMAAIRARALTPSPEQT